MSMRNVTIAATTPKPMPPPTMAATVNPPIKTVIAIQMNPAMNPASSALMVRDLFGRVDGVDMGKPYRIYRRAVG